MMHEKEKHLPFIVILPGLGILNAVQLSLALPVLDKVRTLVFRRPLGEGGSGDVLPHKLHLAG